MKGKQPPSFSSGENANQRLPAPQWCWLAHLNLCFTFVTNEIMYNFLFFFLLLPGYFELAIFYCDSQGLYYFTRENPQLGIVVYFDEKYFHFLFFCF